MGNVKFGSKIGLIAATVGSAVGLGNIWRFPAETQANGGAAFLLVYIICVCLLGIPLMLAEFSLGRGTGGDAVSAFKILRPGTKWWLTGLLGVIGSYMILSFYLVVAGWTLEYFVQSVSGDLFENVSGATGLDGMEKGFHQKMEEYVCGDMGPLVNLFLMIILNVAVLVGGVQKGIEKISTWLMPILFLLLITFCSVSLSMPGASKGLEFFFNPDFSKVDGRVIINALGQAFFSMSLGMGTLITYGSYFPKSTKLTQTAFTVAGLDLLVAVLMGMIIFPAVTSFGLTGAELRGQTLVFVTLPEVFSQMPGTRIWSILFFLLLMVAALTSTISLGEVTTAFLQDRFKMKRYKAVLATFLPMFLLSTLCSLSFGRLRGLKIAGLTIFNFMDTVSTNYILPVGAFLICIFIGWILPSSYFKKELIPSLGKDKKIYGVAAFLVKWIAPPMILLILFSSFL